MKTVTFSVTRFTQTRKRLTTAHIVQEAIVVVRRQEKRVVPGTAEISNAHCRVPPHGEFSGF